MLKVFEQLTLARGEVIWRRKHNSLCAGILRLTGNVHRLHKACVGYTNQHGHSSLSLFTNALNKFASQASTETRRLTGCPQDKQAVHTACQNMLNQPLKTDHIESILVQ